MLSKLGRSLLLMAAIVAVTDLGAGQSARADVTVDFNISPAIGNDVKVFLPVSGDSTGQYTYYLTVSNGFLFANTIQTTPGHFMYEVTLSITDNSADASIQSQLIDSVTTVTAGDQTIFSNQLVVTLSDTFSAPTGPNLTLNSTLAVTSITSINGGSDTGGGGDPDTVSASGTYANSHGSPTSATSSVGAQNAGGTYQGNNRTVTNPSNHPDYTLSNAMTFSLGYDADKAIVQNTVTLTANGSPAIATPEPSTIAMALSGLVAFSVVKLRRRLGSLKASA